MVNLEAVLTVSRIIPKDALAGLLTGAFSLHGGVVRDTAGRIVAYLALPAEAAASALSSAIPGLSLAGDAFQAYQLHKIGLVIEDVCQRVGTLLNLSVATTALSGLGLIVSVAGFAFLSGKLTDVRKRLDRIEQTTKKSLHILEAFQYGKLKGALDNLRHASDVESDAVRQGCLMQAKRDFAQLTHHYHHLWRGDTTLDDAQLIDDSFTLSMLGGALCANRKLPVKVDSP